LSSGTITTLGSNVNNNAERQLQQGTLTTHSTPIWGAGTSVGASDGEFANAFVESGSYIAGDNPTSWTALSIYDTASARTPGNAYWTRSTLGYSQGGYWWNTTPLGSNSAANGAAIFDSDFLDNGGAAGDFGSGTSPGAHKGELISPRIDLTGYTDEAIAIEFFSWFRNFEISELSVSISTDDGSTWSSTDYRPLTSSETQETVRAVFLTATAGVVNLTQCRIKFTFDGYYYFALVDDVTVKQAPAYDLAIVQLDDATGRTGLNFGDQVHITGNRFFPIGQLSQDAGHISFGANVKNLGALDITLSQTPALNLNVERFDAATSLWSSVHTQSITAPQDVTAGGGLSLTGVLDNTSWMTVGSYRSTYTASFTGTDANTANNTAQHFFDITANNYASKVAADVNGNPVSDRRIFPGGGPFSAWEYGTVFNLDNAAGYGLEINEIKYNYFLTSSFSGSDRLDVRVNVYRVNDNDNNGIITNLNELTQVGVVVSSLTGLGTTLPREAYYTATVTGILNPTTGAPLGELPSGKHFISILFNPYLGGGVSTFDSNELPWMGASEAKDYNMNYGLISNSTDFVFNPSSLSTTDTAGTRGFSNIGFGVGVVPSIGVSFTSNISNSTVADGNFNAGSTWSTGLVPAGSDAVVIEHDVIIDTDVILTGITTVSNLNSLTVQAGATMTLGGSLINDYGGDLIFKSDDSGVGQLMVNTGGSLSGTATVERYVPSLANTRRAFRCITPAVTTTGSIYQNWQENGNFLAGYGTHITGSMSGANGFDVSGSGDPSMFTYEHLNNAWEAVPNTNTDLLEAGKAYRIFIRGDRNFDLTNSTQQSVNSNVILRAKGNLNLGDVNLVGNVVGGNDAGALSRQAGDFSFIGNPYQAIVDFEDLVKTNINPNFMYIWNPNLSTSGMYETIDVSGAVVAGQYVQPGQAFFVLTENNGDASLTFNEAAKAPDEFSNTNFITPINSHLVAMELLNDDALVLDRLSIKFDGSNEINSTDAPKFFNQHESLSALTQGNNYSVEHREFPLDGETVQLQLIGHDRSDYELSMSIDLPINYHAVLIDNYLNESTVVSQGSHVVAFTADSSIAGSIDVNRFSLTFVEEELLSISEVDVMVFPNPSNNGQVTLSSPLFIIEDVQVSIVNMMGQVLSSNNYNKTSQGAVTLNTTTLTLGTYIVTLASKSLKVSKKIMIE
jgi:hypothetical protein